MVVPIMSDTTRLPGRLCSMPHRKFGKSRGDLLPTGRKTAAAPVRCELIQLGIALRNAGQELLVPTGLQLPLDGVHGGVGSGWLLT